MQKKQSSLIIYQLNCMRIPTLTPILNKSVHSFIFDSTEKLHALIDQHESPLHVIFPNTLRKNKAIIEQELKKHVIDYSVLYAVKVNKSQNLLKTAVSENCGADVSSVFELRDALQAGVDPKEVCASGPAKSLSFIKELIKYNITFSIDSFEELKKLSKIHAQEKRKIPIIIRYKANFTQDRFGICSDKMADSIEFISRNSNTFQFKGFHFHLPSYHVKDRSKAFSELLPWIDMARNKNLITQIINIGGGIPTQYISEDNFKQYTKNHSIDNYCSLTLPESFYPYGKLMNTKQWIGDFFESKLSTNQNIATFINHHSIKLLIEPGRRLVDQSAISIFRVSHSKHVKDNRFVVFVEGMSFNACETWFNSEYLVDPIHISKQNNDKNPCRAYVSGSSCLSNDLLSYRYIDFEFPPQYGDLLIYANTAGYQMDLLENNFHRIPFPNRISVEN